MLLQNIYLYDKYIYYGKKEKYINSENLPNIANNVRIHVPMKNCKLLTELIFNSFLYKCTVWLRSYTYWAISYTTMSSKIWWIKQTRLCLSRKKLEKKVNKSLTKWLVWMCKFTHFPFGTKSCKHVLYI